MPCYKPITGYQVPSAKANGKKAIVFSFQPNAEPIQLPCQKCIGCRLEKSRQWAVRCVHESQMHKENCFVTLTYADKHMPSDHSLHKRHHQLFIKKLRKRFAEKRIRYFMCGEYGSEENTKRPHYHLCLFGIDFPDKVIYSATGENTLYMSKILDDLWQKGLSTIGELNFATAAYTARYCMKKIDGEMAEDHYLYIDETGHHHKLQPEYVAMSRRPGIGKTWFDKYKNDVYPTDEVISNGMPAKPPKYYDYIHENNSPELMEQIKEIRNTKRKNKDVEEYLDKRLAQKETCKQAKYKTSNKRTL
jgi:hypothetical protein